MTKANKKACLKITKNLRKGDLLLWKNYLLDNGKKKDKLLIILNNCNKNNYVIFVLTTSKTDIYNRNSYAQIDTIRFPAGKIKCFPLETVVDLKHWETKGVRYISELFYNNNLEIIGRLPEQEIANINLIVEKAITLNQEVKNLILTV